MSAVALSKPQRPGLASSSYIAKSLGGACLPGQALRPRRTVAVSADSYGLCSQWPALAWSCLYRNCL
jgi:hypothetical protein